MAWQDPGGNGVPGGPGGPGDPTLDETRPDWAGPSSPPAGPPPGPPGEPRSQPSVPAAGPPPPVASAYPAPGMAWAPPDPAYAMATASGLRFADVLPRFVAWLVDILILGVIGIGISWAFSLAVLGSFDWRSFVGGDVLFDENTMGRLLLVSFAGTVVTTAIDFVYFAFQWSSGGRATLGMRLLRLEVGNAADGRTLTLAQAGRRWFAMGTWLDLLAVVPLIGALASLGQLAWYIVLLATTSSHPSRQGLHDRFAETAVVQTEPAGNGLLVGCIVIAAIIGLFILISIVALIFLGSQVSSILEEVGNSI